MNVGRIFSGNNFCTFTANQSNNNVNVSNNQQSNERKNEIDKQSKDFSDKLDSYGRAVVLFGPIAELALPLAVSNPDKSMNINLNNK